MNSICSPLFLYSDFVSTQFCLVSFCLGLGAFSIDIHEDYAPAGTPQPIIDKLNNEIAAIMKTPEMVKILDSQGAEIDLLTGTDFTKFMESESAKWDQVIKRNKITNE